MLAGNAPPIFFSVLPKRKRAVHGPREKTLSRWEGTVEVRQVSARGVVRTGVLEVWDTLCAAFRLCSLGVPGQRQRDLEGRLSFDLQR